MEMKVREGYKPQTTAPSTLNIMMDEAGMRNGVKSPLTSEKGNLTVDANVNVVAPPVTTTTLSVSPHLPFAVLHSSILRCHNGNGFSKLDVSP
jgi:hypothetical protein